MIMTITYNNCLKEKELFEVLAKHSPESFHELKLGYAYGARSDILSEELEEFFINWNNRITKRSLSFIVLHEHNGVTLASSKNMTIIEKYEKLGIIKFEIGHVLLEETRFSIWLD